MQVKSEFIARNKTNEEITNAIGADLVYYQALEDLRKPLTTLNCCDACFTGRYPTDISDDNFALLEKERINSNS